MENIHELRESASGWHFYSLYRNNPHEWYLKYILGLIPVYTKPSFVLGKAIHDAAWLWWSTRNKEKALSRGVEIVKNSRPLVEDSEKFDTIRENVKPMIEALIETWTETGRLDEYNPVETETPYELKIGPDEQLTFTLRPDLIIENKETHMKFVVDYKHTAYSPKKFYQIADRSDQVTAYIWGVAKAHPEWNIGGAYINGIYKRGNVLSADHYYAYRSESYRKVFEMGLVGTIIEVSQKVKALKDYPWPVLFPPNWSFVEIYGSDYEPLLGKNIKKDEVPPGFTKDPEIDIEQTLKNLPEWKIEDFVTSVRRTK